MKDSKLDVTIGPYETYEDALFGYKVSTNFEILPLLTISSVISIFFLDPECST